jgi:hypothetical protein
VDRPAAGDDRTAGNLNIPTAGTTGKKGKDAGNSLIQEVKPGSQPAASADTSAHKPATRSATAATAGLTAVSTTKRVPPATPAISTSHEALASPSGHRDITVTSPSGSDIADADAAFAASLAAESGLEVPKFTVKERGHISMGDFENVNATARSNRPNELVYRIELPKITKASAIVLDIAERCVILHGSTIFPLVSCSACALQSTLLALNRQLNLSYPELYSLVVKLPYPVFDAKGTAKYDKTSKSLTVTLPVRPPAALLVGVSSPHKADSATEGVVQELGESTDAASGSPTKATPAKKSSVGHGRWVEGSAGSSTPGSGEGTQADAPLSLHEEVKRQAEAALQAAKLAAASKPAQAPAPAPVATPSVASPVKPATAPVPPASTGAFIAATAFAGRKEGYFFKKDRLGLGYYADAKQGAAKTPAAATATPAPAASVEPVPAPVAAADAFASFPFVARQTKPSVAVIVEVANIDPSSVKVAFHTHAVHITFRAFEDLDAAAETKIGRKLYGAVLRVIDAACPGGFDTSRCKFDVAEKNMAVVLTKLLPAYWSGAGAEAAAQGESKSGEADQSASGLLQVLPYTEPPAAVATSTPAPTVGKAASGTSESAQKAKTPEPAKSVKAEDAKAVKALESAMQALQFSSSDALFELD